MSPLPSRPIQTMSSTGSFSIALEMFDFKHPRIHISFIQLSFVPLHWILTGSPKILMDLYSTTPKVKSGPTVAMKQMLMAILIREIMTVVIKLTAMMMKRVEKMKETVLCIFLRCPTYCDSLTRSSAFAIVSEFFEGFVC